MPESAAILTIDQACAGGGLMRRLVLRELAPLRRDRLRLFLPEGGQLVLGDPTRR